MKRLVELKEPTTMASADKAYKLVAGESDFQGGGLKFPTPFGAVTVKEGDMGPFMDLPDDFDLAAFAESRPDVLVVNNG